MGVIVGIVYRITLRAHSQTAHTRCTVTSSHTGCVVFVVAAMHSAWLSLESAADNAASGEGRAADSAESEE